VIEVDVSGKTLRTFTDVKAPRHLSVDSEGRVLVADFVNHRILLLNSHLEQQRFLVDTHSRVNLWQPARMCYSEVTSQLYVVHGKESSSSSYFISVFKLPSGTEPSPTARQTSNVLIPSSPTASFTR